MKFIVLPLSSWQTFCGSVAVKSNFNVSKLFRAFKKIVLHVICVQKDRVLILRETFYLVEKVPETLLIIQFSSCVW